jgi:hypothetical protein
MSEHSEDGFDRWLREEMRDLALRKLCEAKGKYRCGWFRNREGMLECRTCALVVDE